MLLVFTFSLVNCIVNFIVDSVFIMLSMKVADVPVSASMPVCI
jgi:hypothetical protein